MSKVKMKCARCGKHFKSSSAKQTLCPDCEARERRQRAAAKASGPAPTQSATAAPVAAPKIVGPAAGILVPGLAPAPTEEEPAAQPAAHATHTERPHEKSGESARADGKGHGAPRAEAGAKHGKPRSATPKAPREPKPPTPPFQITDEIRAAVETRYLELAQPVEFDGIRTQIASEMSVPKVAVKRVIRELRDRMRLPSWWELRAYSGSDEDLERIRAAYLPLLPVPEIGVHKQIADQIGLSPIVVYQGIRRIRAEMRLPQYNPPEAHEATPAPQPAAESAPEPAGEQAAQQSPAQTPSATSAS